MPEIKLAVEETFQKKNRVENIVFFFTSYSFVFRLQSTETLTIQFSELNFDL